MKQLTVIHTSDWHIGHQLYKRKREDEFEAFFNWLIAAIRSTGAEVLIVAGDIFDSVAPGAAAQKLYYNFLHNLVQTSLRHIVITAGNHDSPSLLTVAGDLLKRFNIHVIGDAAENPADELLMLADENGETELIVCAAPYLREKDLRLYTPGDSETEVESGIIKGMEKHYGQLAALAQTKAAGKDIPVIATGHLFATGATLAEDGTERMIHIGSLGGVPPEIFPETFDYVALGHLHRPQQAGPNPTRRYSGSPLPLSFGEASQPKTVTVIRFTGRQPAIELLPVPTFRTFRTISGSGEIILKELKELLALEPEEKIWVEIRHTGPDSPTELSERAFELAKNSQVEILCVKPTRRNIQQTSGTIHEELAELDPEEVFLEYMRNERPDYDEEAQRELLQAFRQLVTDYNDDQQKDNG